jgi:hypothetical protein
MRILQEFLLRSSLSNLVLQASKGDKPGGINRLYRYYKAKYYSSKDTGPSRDICTKPPEEDITVLNRY